MMEIRPAALEGVQLIEPRLFGDARGDFHDSLQAEAFAAAGLPCRFSQISVSRSRPGVLRGLHLQWPRTQAKLVEVVAGTVFDVAVDLRPGSPRWGQWESFVLSADQPRLLWLPHGFAHGFLALEPAVMIYHLDGAYDPAGQVSLRWDDPALAIAWPDPAPILSDKDRDAAGLDQIRRLMGHPGR